MHFKNSDLVLQLTLTLLACFCLEIEPHSCCIEVSLRRDIQQILTVAPAALVTLNPVFLHILKH